MQIAVMPIMTYWAAGYAKVPFTVRNCGGRILFPLIGKDGVYMIISDTEVSDIGTGWIAEYYGSQGVSVTVEEIDRIGEHYFVYQVREE